MIQSITKAFIAVNMQFYTCCTLLCILYRLPAPLKFETAVQAIMKGILTNQRMVYIPWYAQYILTIKS